MTERDPEFIAAFDDCVERILHRVCRMGADRFVIVEAKMATLVRFTNSDPTRILASIRRLVKAGRIQRATRAFGGETFCGLVCEPHHEREKVASDELDLTPEDCDFLRKCGIAVEVPVETGCFGVRR